MRTNKLKKPCVCTAFSTLAEYKKKTSVISNGGFVFALPIFPGSHPPSIVGVYVLNFCVRDGEQWERRRWRIQRPERVAAVGEGRRRTVAKDIRRAPQQETGGLSTVPFSIYKKENLRYF